MTLYCTILRQLDVSSKLWTYSGQLTCITTSKMIAEWLDARKMKRFSAAYFTCIYVYIKRKEIIRRDIYICTYTATYCAYVAPFRAARSSHFPSIFANERKTERNPLTRHVLSCTNSLTPRFSMWWRLIMLTSSLSSDMHHTCIRAPVARRGCNKPRRARSILCLELLKGASEIFGFFLALYN